MNTMKKEVLNNINLIDKAIENNDNYKENRKFKTLVDSLERTVKLLGYETYPESKEEFEKETLQLDLIKSTVQKHYNLLINSYIEKSLQENNIKAHHDFVVTYEKLHRLLQYIDDLKKNVKRKFNINENIRKNNERYTKNYVEKNRFFVIAETKAKAKSLALDITEENNDVPIAIHDSGITTEKSKYIFIGIKSYSEIRGRRGDLLYIDSKIDLPSYINKIAPYSNEFKEIKLI